MPPQKFSQEMIPAFIAPIHKIEIAFPYLKIIILN
jgi:hypothetical protein